MMNDIDTTSVSNALLSRPLARVGLAIGGLTLMAGGVGSIIASAYVEEHLAPAIAQDLSTSLNRPVTLGPLTYISPTSIRFGRSSIPATEMDVDAVEMDAIAIQFSPWNAWDDGTVPLSVTLIRPDIFLDQNSSGNWLDTEIDLSNSSRFPVRKVSFQQARLSLKPAYDGFKVHPRAIDYLEREADLNRKSLRNPFHRQESASAAALPNAIAMPNEIVKLHGLNASFTMDDQEEFLAFKVRGHATQGGRLQTEGRVVLDGGRVETDIRAHRLAIAQFSALLPSSLLVEDGRFSGTLQFVGEPGQPISLYGTAKLRNFSAWAEGEPNPFTDTRGTLAFEGQTIQVEKGAMTYGWIPFDMAGTIHLEDGVNLQAQVTSVNADDFMATFNLDLPFPAEGALKTDNLTVTGPFGQTVFAGTVTDAKPVVLDQVEVASVRTDFTLNKGTDVLTLVDTTFVPAVGGEIVGNARFKLGDIDDAVVTARADGMSADEIADLYGLSMGDIQLGQLSASTQVIITEHDVQTQLTWALAEGTYDASGVLATADNRVYLRDTTVQIGQERVHASGELVDNRWQATLSSDGFSLASAIPNAAGRVKGDVTVAGALDNMNLAAIQAKGNVDVVDIMPGLTDPLQVAFDWSGDRLHIQQARTSWFEADGWIQATLAGPHPDITGMNLNLRLQEMNLSELPVTLPLPVSGTTQFTGTMTGTPAAPHLDGHLRLADFAVGSIALDPELQGRVRLSPDQVVHLALSGERDEMRVAGTLEAFDFELQREQATVNGQVVNEQLHATLQDIPLNLVRQISTVDLDSNAMLAALNGRLSGQVDMNWADSQNPTMIAEVAIANPTLGALPSHLQARHQGDRLTGTIHYADAVATLTEGHLRFGDSHLHLAGRVASDDLSGRIDIERGDLKDAMTLLRTVPSDMGVSSSVMAFTPPDGFAPDFDMAGLMDAPRRISGEFAGAIDVRFNPQRDDFQAQVGLDGSRWRIGPIRVDQISLANGQLNGAYMNVPELRLAGLTYGDISAPNTALIASLNTSQQTGSIQLERVPLTLMSQWFNSPVTVGGELGAIAHWQQTGMMPIVTGNLSVDNPTLGNFGTDAIQVGFSFEDDVLQVGQWHVPGNPVELIATGRIPIRLPFMETVPNAPIRFVAQSDAEAFGTGVSAQARHRNPSTDFAVDGAEEVVLSLGLIQPSFSIADLENLVETDEVPNGWALYLDIADLEPEELKSALTQEVPINLVMVDHLMNSPLGEQILTFVGQVIHTPSGHANVQALRSALVFSAHDDGRISVLEFLNNYPHDEIFIDLNKLADVLKILKQAQAGSENTSS